MPSKVKNYNYTLLKTSISALDVEQFLFHYLSAIKKGVSFNLPTSNEITPLHLEWTDCIPLQAGPISSEFIKKLTLFWHRLINELLEKNLTVTISNLLAHLQCSVTKPNYIIEDGVKLPQIGNPYLNRVEVNLSTQVDKRKPDPS